MSSTAHSSRVAGDLTEVSVQPKKIEESVRALRTLLTGDEREQRETFAFLKKALNEDRPSGRKIFPSS